jgi:hypothetical protein
MSKLEPFPELTPVNTATDYRYEAAEVRARGRKKSNLGDDPRGDTEVAAISTLYDHTPPLSTTVRINCSLQASDTDAAVRHPNPAPTSRPSGPSHERSRRCSNDGSRYH